ncbi:MAG: polysaccharide biosynthesis C-terminal domain-containing protein [Gammaproteobacteria bacterium]|nr:polysaccharide biosynthesis C-terminal domain-containing protein [Gammaproteobacteria bacterium]
MTDDGLYRRVFKNSAMLTAGKLYTALAGLVYLALATRALGAHNFGVLILIHAYAVAIRDFITLKTAQCVVRYGALCLENNAREDFQKLVKFTTLLDIVFCIIGTLVGILALSRVGPWFGVTEDLELVAAVYCCMILFNFKTTSLGLLRLFNRFDLVALMLMVVPTIRLAGACTAYFFYQHISAFLLFWFLAGAVQCLATVWFGWREFSRQGFGKDMNLSMKYLIRPHEGIISFIWASHVNRTLYTSTVHVATLIIGAMSGPAGAGLFKIAQESAAVLIKPAQLFTETVYPEMTKIAVTRQFSRLWNVIRHSALAGGAIAGFILLLVFLFGQSLLGLFFGAEYAGAYDILVLLMIGAAITMASFALEPALFSIGRPEISMHIRVFTTILNITVLVLLLPEIGLAGAGVAAIAGSLATALLLLYYSRRLIRKSADDAPEGSE